jgi:hypothetical protein
VCGTEVVFSLSVKLNFLQPVSKLMAGVFNQLRCKDMAKQTHIIFVWSEMFSLNQEEYDKITKGTNLLE